MFVPFQDANDEPDMEETELTVVSQKKRNESMERLRRSVGTTLLAVNDTILDNVVARFSVVNGHKVRGNWRYILTTALISIPIIVFSVMLWYQLFIQCYGNTLTVGPFGNVVDSVDPLLNDYSVYYCGSYGQFVGENGFIQYFYCTLNAPYTSFGVDNIPQCRMFKSFYTDINGTVTTNGGASCFAGNGAIFINYSQCIPLVTALVNSLQYATYAALATIYLYLITRVALKGGPAALFSYDMWLQVLKNERKVEVPETKLPAV